MKKQVGFIGLGKMGENMVLNLLDKKYDVVIYNRSPEPVKKLSKKHKKAIPTYDFKDMSEKLTKPRIAVIMIPAGKPVEDVTKKLSQYFERGDIIIDGGNSHYKDSVRRYNELRGKGIHFMDMGTSGGLEGARHGASLMIGGDKSAFRKAEPLFRDLAVKNGYGYMGKSGAGHFVKTIHNGIEYALLESYSEGFETLKKSKYKLNLSEVSKVWSNGSVIRSWITELAEKVFSRNNNLSSFKGKIGGGETGNWALKIAKKEKSEAKNLKHAIEKRKSSQRNQSFSTKFISAIRKEFGGHEEP